MRDNKPSDRQKMTHTKQEKILRFVADGGRGLGANLKLRFDFVTVICYAATAAVRASSRAGEGSDVVGGVCCH